MSNATKPYAFHLNAQQLAHRLGTVARHLEREAPDVPLFVLVEGKRIPLLSSDFQIDDDGTFLFAALPEQKPEQLTRLVHLLRRTQPYVGRAASVGAQQLSTEISEVLAQAAEEQSHG